MCIVAFLTPRPQVSVVVVFHIVVEVGNRQNDLRASDRMRLIVLSAAIRIRFRSLTTIFRTGENVCPNYSFPVRRIIVVVYWHFIDLFHVLVAKQERADRVLEGKRKTMRGIASIESLALEAVHNMMRQEKTAE